VCSKLGLEVAIYIIFILAAPARLQMNPSSDSTLSSALAQLQNLEISQAIFFAHLRFML
jgi:hypothetical protein